MPSAAWPSYLAVAAVIFVTTVAPLRAADGAADPGGVVDHLPLQIGQRHRVVVDDADHADAGGGEILQQRRAEAAGADHQHARRLEFLLAGAANLAQHEMAGIAFDFLWRQAHALPGGVGQ